MGESENKLKEKFETSQMVKDLGRSNKILRISVKSQQ